MRSIGQAAFRLRDASLHAICWPAQGPDHEVPTMLSDHRAAACGAGTLLHVEMLGWMLRSGLGGRWGLANLW